MISGKKEKSVEIVRWDPEKNFELSNLALMSSAAATAHQKILQSKDLAKYSPEVLGNFKGKQEKLLAFQKGKAKIFLN